MSAAPWLRFLNLAHPLIAVPCMAKCLISVDMLDVRVSKKSLHLAYNTPETMPKWNKRENMFWFSHGIVKVSVFFGSMFLILRLLSQMNSQLKNPTPDTVDHM